MRISVVVPTRGRPEALERCRAALAAQSVPVEVVVVEDVEGRGAAWARNEGVKRCRGDVVCFTDDDCVPGPGWAETLAAPILAGVMQATAGRIRMGNGATAADRAWETIVGYLQEQASAPGSASPGFAATANLAATRALLERLPFDESFPGAAGEDRDWAGRAEKDGASPLLIDAAEVLHQPGMGMGDFLRQQYRYGEGAARYRASSTGRRFGRPQFYWGLIRRGFGRGLGCGVLVCLANAATLAGIFTVRSGAVSRR